MPLERLTTPEELISLQRAISAVRVEESIIDYITEIVGRTRGHRSLVFGASPRASIALLFVSQGRAAMQGRDFVVPDDVKALAPPVLRHRIGVHPDAEIEGVSPDQCIEEILREVRVPKIVA
jgi:MoxR-like ATPase